MKKAIKVTMLILTLSVIIITFTGCTLKVETTENSVSASVDGETSEKVNSVIDWIKERLNKIFNTNEEKPEIERA